MKDLVIAILLGLLVSIIITVVSYSGQKRWQKAELEMIGCVFIAPYWHYLIYFLIWFLFFSSFVFGGIKLINLFI